VPIGTMAHEYLQTYQALGVRLRDFQKAALEDWVQEYRGDLGIALTDVVGMDAFLADFDLYFAKLFDGLRHDSGDPVGGARRRWRTTRSCASTRTRSAWCSRDGLDSSAALRAVPPLRRPHAARLRHRHEPDNDVGLTPLNIVMKLPACNGQPVAKLSDSPARRCATTRPSSPTCGRSSTCATEPETHHAEDHRRPAELHDRRHRGQRREDAMPARRPRHGADLVVFPSSSLTGYYPGDLLEEPDFLERVRAGLDACARPRAQLPGCTGWSARRSAPRGPGKRCTTRCVVIRAGEIVLRYAKQLLPTYNIFDERATSSRARRRAGAAHRRSAGRPDDLRGRLERRRRRLRRQPLPAPGATRRPTSWSRSTPARPSIGKREQRHASSATRAAATAADAVRQPDRRPGPARLRRRSFAIEPARGVRFEARRFDEDVTTLRFDERPLPRRGRRALPPVPPEACRRWPSTRRRSCSACATTRAAAASRAVVSAPRAASTAR
jgi:hypothetical protein